MKIKKIAVIGAGLMGNALAQVFASNSELKVALHDIQERDEPLAPIEKNLDALIAKSVATESEKAKILSRISFGTDLKTAVEDADFVIECVPEVMEIKQNLFAEIEEHCRPETIFATNTSVMSVTEIASKCKHKERVVGAHFWNPGHLIPLVEVVKTEFSDNKAVDATMKLLADCGKKPILCKKDVPGFIANRLQHALWREAFYMVQEGIADPATVDDAVKYGPGLRWPILGPMENSDLVGIQLSYNIHEYILKYLADNHKPSPCLKEMLDKGDVGFSSGKGWQEWTPQAIEELKIKLQEYLIDSLRTNKN